jgi:TPP-dependent pyruvate/acetoin dehydrogenase alpha subunit
MGDPGTSYRTKEEVEKWKKQDPIERFRVQLLQGKILTESEVTEINIATAQEVDQAVKFAVASPEPSLEVAIEDVYYTAE